jgi:Leucine-rich repeat (LRR) protein
MNTNQNINYYLNSLDKNITELNISYRHLITFPDVSSFTKLKKIDCSNNNIIFILSMFLPTNLEYLDCSFNKLNHIPYILNIH